MKRLQLADMLEKELTKQRELRFENEELVRERDNLQRQAELVNGLLRSSEAKLSDVSLAHAALASSYSAAQEKIESLQDQVNELQDKFVSSTACEAQFSEYEDKLRRWERRCRALEEKLSESAEQVLDLQQSVERANCESQEAIDSQSRLKTELRDAHDKLIQMTASLRAVEAKLETDMMQSDGSCGIQVVSDLSSLEWLNCCS
jgi:chromosome segregation ATPase